ncbi:MAG: hypothetical protein IJG16_12050 [Clostridia bacterium]|nr:hypothetical protein [Clostridia bacterium]
MSEMLKNVAAFNGSACGAADPTPSACGAADPDKEEAPASACGAADPDKQ